MTVKIAVFASGSGTNFQAIQEAISRHELDASIQVVVTDKPGAGVVKRAQAFHIPVVELLPKAFFSKDAYERAIVSALEERDVEFIVLAGYMRLIGPVLLKKFEGRIVNIHPSLLPAFPGKDAIGQAFEAGVPVTGVTVHYVDAGMDTGPIIAQQEVEVISGNRAATEARIHEVEHILYASTLKQVFQTIQKNELKG